MAAWGRSSLPGESSPKKRGPASKTAANNVVVNSEQKSEQLRTAFIRIIGNTSFGERAEMKPNPMFTATHVAFE
jgi:hypothetical protein